MEKDDISYRALKALGSKEIQDAFAKAICELTGEDYQVDINLIDFDATNGAWMWDSTKITLTASRKQQFHAVESSEAQESVSPA